VTAALGALPIGAVLVAMAGLGWSAARAGAVGLALAVLLAATAFAFDAPGRAALGIAAEAAHTTAVILWIVLPALMLHAYGQETGGIARLRDALAGITDDARAQVILIAWFFGLFM
jgi:lactate permease